MKIDSPTFISETTFISASVVFSSGSQKFGNTDDDTHIFIGDISGSARTTGSFGLAKVNRLRLTGDTTGDPTEVAVGDTTGDPAAASVAGAGELDLLCPPLFARIA